MPTKPYKFTKPATSTTENIYYQGSFDEQHPETVLAMSAKNHTALLEAVTFSLESRDGQEYVLLDDGEGYYGYCAKFTPFELHSPYRIHCQFSSVTVADVLTFYLLVKQVR